MFCRAVPGQTASGIRDRSLCRFMPRRGLLLRMPPWYPRILNRENPCLTIERSTICRSLIPGPHRGRPPHPNREGSIRGKRWPLTWERPSAPHIDGSGRRHSPYAVMGTPATPQLTRTRTSWSPGFNAARCGTAERRQAKLILRHPCGKAPLPHGDFRNGFGFPVRFLWLAALCSWLRSYPRQDRAPPSGHATSVPSCRRRCTLPGHRMGRASPT